MVAPRMLCHLDDVPDPGSRGFRIEGNGRVHAVFVVRRGDAVYGYLNRCPHTGLSLDWAPDRFLEPDGELIVCATHGALFRIEDGYCVAGPCAGASLRPVSVRLQGDAVILVPDYP